MRHVYRCHEYAPAAGMNFTRMGEIFHGGQRVGHPWSMWSSSAAVPDGRTSRSRKAPFAAGAIDDGYYLLRHKPIVKVKVRAFI